MIDLVPVWAEIKNLLSQNLSLIAVRDKSDDRYVAKSPYSDWKQFQKERATESFLWNQLEKYNTSAVAIVGGAISENLEIIDIDEKYYPGISALVLQSIRLLFPGLYQKLRIHKSPTNGHHIFYKVIGTIAGNLKIASRETTKEEKIEYILQNPNVKKDIKTRTFIETRGEGGYVLAPPSLGYTVIQGDIIPTLTLDERETLINICRSYNQIVKEPKIYKTPQEKISYYDENPYNHYSRTADPKELLEEIGWKFVNQRGDYLWFTRPGKDRGVSGSFNLSTRIFWSFSSSTDLEQERGYFLATLLIDYKFNGDKTKTSAWLTQNGYGIVNKKEEERQVKKLAISDKTLPENFSEEAKKGYEEFKADLEKQHPHGIFWELVEDEIIINREKLYHVSQELGYRVYNDKLVKIDGKLFYEAELREYFDCIKSYINIDDAKINEDVKNSYESFIEKHGKFSSERLKIIDQSEILLDTKYICYKFYKDKWIVITKTNIDIKSYDELNKLVPRIKVQNRELKLGESGKYIEFLKLACELDQNEDYLKKIVGYYAHEYNDETMGYMCVLTEKCSESRDGGGSGKNIFVKLLGYTTSFVDRAGSEISFNDNKIFQAWNGEKIFSISDLPKDFDLSYFKNISTGGFTQWKLHKDHKVIHIENSFKLIFSTNFSFVCTDGGLSRRLIALEFTNFFSRSRPVDTYFGAYFPKEWNDEDWAGYDGFVLKSIQHWIRSGCKLESKQLSDTGWQKQFEITYGITVVNFIDQYWNKWVKEGFVGTEQFKKDLNLYFEENLISASQKQYATSTKINRALDDYSQHKNVYFDKDYHNGGLGKGRFFRLNNLPF